MRKSTTLIQLQTLHVITQPLRIEISPWRNRRQHDHGFAFQAKGHGKKILGRKSYLLDKESNIDNRETVIYKKEKELEEMGDKVKNSKAKI